MNANVELLPKVSKLDTGKHQDELNVLSALLDRIADKQGRAKNAQRCADTWDMATSPFKSKASWQDDADRIIIEADALQIKYYKKLCGLTSDTYKELMIVAKAQDNTWVGERDTQHFDIDQPFDDLPGAFKTQEELLNIQTSSNANS